MLLPFNTGNVSVSIAEPELEFVPIYNGMVTYRLYLLLQAKTNFLLFMPIFTHDCYRQLCVLLLFVHV